MLNRAFASFHLPKLPFAPTALEPLYTAEILSFHHGKHHQAYVDNLNNAVGDRDISLIDIVQNEA